MTNSISIILKPGGLAELDLTSKVQGFHAVVQNALVNLLTDKDIDVIYPDRGTRLLETGLNSNIYNFQSASHACNFAAADTLFFSREYEQAESQDKLDQIQIIPSSLTLEKLDAEVGFSAIDGRQISFPIRS